MRRNQDEILQALAERPEPTVALNPLTGLQLEDLISATTDVAIQSVRQPLILSKHLASYGRKIVDILADRTDYAPANGDRRFTDSAWQDSGVYQHLLQFYLAMNETLEECVDDLDLDTTDERRAQFLLRLIEDSLAPTNTLLGNPIALRKAWHTRGASLLKGARNLLDDMRNNHGIPAQVKGDAFEVGKNLATTPGAVVFSNEVLELIQYTPTTTKVFQRPLLMIGAMINKFYALDMTPDRSMIKFCVDQGQQVFVISWANPGKNEANWGVERYATAAMEAIVAVKSITRSKDLNVYALCSGAMTMAGTALDLTALEYDKFFVAGTSDHITPWKACYRAALAYGGNNEFVLSNSGHIQTLLNSPSKKSASFFTNRQLPESADAWREAAELQQGSWWLYWERWIGSRSGIKKTAPKKLGNKTHPAGANAPGNYVFQQSE